MKIRTFKYIILALSIIILVHYLFLKMANAESVVPTDLVWSYKDIQKEYSAKKYEKDEPSSFIYDGDTFFVSNKQCMDKSPVLCKRIGVRIRGIDTPELHSAKCERELDMALKARSFLRWMLDTQPFELHNIERGRNYRVVADVYIFDGSVDPKFLKSKGDKLPVKGNVVDILLQKPYYRKYTGKRQPWCTSEEIEQYKLNK
jgi:endonuclease YncB( thermonuclease family)